MTSLTIPYNKLVAAQELISDAIHDLDGKMEDEAIAQLAWARGEIAGVIIAMQRRGEE